MYMRVVIPSILDASLGTETIDVCLRTEAGFHKAQTGGRVALIYCWAVWLKLTETRSQGRPILAKTRCATTLVLKVSAVQTISTIKWHVSRDAMRRTADKVHPYTHTLLFSGCKQQKQSKLLYMQH